MVEDGMPCPLCKTASWSTILNKHFQRQVKERYWRPIKKIYWLFFHLTLSRFPHNSPVGPEPLPEKKYPFLEQPSDTFFCPVDGSLLLQPRLTTCCARNLSPEAATRIEGEGGACPLCGEKCWNTVLNKHFQNQVKKLPVHCYNKDKGCGWQGELGALQRHVHSCSWREIKEITGQLDFLE